MTDLQSLVRDASHPALLRALFYGAPGVGKTILAVQTALALGERCLYIPTEPGDESLEDWPELRKRTTVMDYGGINHLGELYTAYQENEFPGHPTIIIDTVDELVETQLDDLVSSYTPAKKTRVIADPKPGLGLKRIEVAGNDDYRFLRDGLRPGIRNLCKLPIHLILTAHVREPSWADDEKREKKGIPLPALRPNLPGQTYKLVSKYVGLMGFMTRRGPKRTISFRTDTDKEESKSRIRALDNEVIDADKLPGIIAEWSKRGR